MNRVGITQVMNTLLCDRVKCVDHLYDLFSSSYSIILLFEPEILSLEYNPELLISFVEHIKKPVIIVPYNDHRRKLEHDHVTYTKLNPSPEEVIDSLEKVEMNYRNFWRA